MKELFSDPSLEGFKTARGQDCNRCHPKAPIPQLKEEPQIVLEMIVAEKLGYTLQELRQRMTLEELIVAGFYSCGQEEKA